MYQCGRCGKTFTDGYEYRDHIKGCRSRRVLKVSKRLK